MRDPAPQNRNILSGLCHFILESWKNPATRAESGWTDRDREFFTPGFERHQGAPWDPRQLSRHPGPVQAHGLCTPRHSAQRFRRDAKRQRACGRPSARPFLHIYCKTASVSGADQKLGNRVAVAIHGPRRFAGAEEDDSRGSIRRIQHHVKKLICRGGAVDPRRPSSADTAVPQRRHPTIPPPPNKAFERVPVETRCSSRPSETNIDECRRVESALRLGCINCVHEMPGAGAPSPIPPREHGEMLHINRLPTDDDRPEARHIMTTPTLSSRRSSGRRRRLGRRAPGCLRSRRESSACSRSG